MRKLKLGLEREKHLRQAHRVSDIESGRAERRQESVRFQASRVSRGPPSHQVQKQTALELIGKAMNEPICGQLHFPPPSNLHGDPSTVCISRKNHVSTCASNCSMNNEKLYNCRNLSDFLERSAKKNHRLICDSFHQLPVWPVGTSWSQPG